VIDIHCHILPRVDDGAKSMEEALKMAEIAHTDGIDQIIATPHLSGYAPVPVAVKDTFFDLNRHLNAVASPLRLSLGCEVAFPVQANDARFFTLAQTRYLLLEFPHDHLPFNAGEVVFNLVAGGYRPIIAHPERNATVLHHPEKLLDLLDRSALVQITGDSIAGIFGPDVQACARYLLKKRAVHFIASDAHSAAYRRPVLSQGLALAAKIIGQNEANKLVTTNPASVLANQPID
jgi:protein-tyrosine phosphatase